MGTRKVRHHFCMAATYSSPIFLITNQIYLSDCHCFGYICIGNGLTMYRRVLYRRQTKQMRRYNGQALYES